MAQQAMNIESTFKKEQYKTLILNTYDDWFSDRSIKWDVGDFMDVVAMSNFDKEFSPFLEDNDYNILTLANLPHLDLGDRPKTYLPKKTESEQLYIVPQSEYPYRLIVKYQDYKPQFHDKTLKEKYSKSLLPDKGVIFEDL